jgi:O-antigen ligase
MRAERAAGGAERAPAGLSLVLACVWVLLLVTFSLPGREGPNSLASLDFVALLKVGTRAGAIGVLFLSLARWWGHPRLRAAARLLWPLGAFAAWGMLSTSWSPLRAVSFGQAVSLVAQIAVVFAIACFWRDRADTERLLRHLTVALLAYSAVILAVATVAFDESGLNRDAPGYPGSNGLVHPTTAGATASLGLVMVVATWRIWGWRWATWLLGPSLVVHGAVLLMAASRTALGVGLAAVALAILGFGSRRWLAPLVLAGSTVAAVYVIADPGLELASAALGQTVQYTRRGETTAQMTTLTGRTDLWIAVWAEFLDAPLTGQGYFVTSRVGAIDVWSGPENRTAHNVVLHALVTTGLIGSALLALGLWQAFGRAVPILWSGVPADRCLLGLFGLLAAWYAGWGMLSESFLGPISPESVTFFSLAGLAVGHAAADETREAAGGLLVGDDR